jgi:hypothetical protein
MENLVTVRMGELAVSPSTEQPEPVAAEFLKVQGQAGSWCCLFYNESSCSCTIYSHRPLACGLLDCTAPAPLLAVAGRELLNRFDLIDIDSPLLPLIRKHEEECPCPDLGRLQKELENISGRAALFEKLAVMVNKDIVFRNQANRSLSISLGMELFYFGRPLFQLLIPLGVQVRETVSGELVLKQE